MIRMFELGTSPKVGVNALSLQSMSLDSRDPPPLIFFQLFFHNFRQFPAKKFIVFLAPFYDCRIPPSGNFL